MPTLLHQLQASAAEGREAKRGHERRRRRLVALAGSNRCPGPDNAKVKVGEMRNLRYEKGGKYND